MKRVVILASGPSLNDGDIDYVRKAKSCGMVDIVIAVSDVGLLKTPWADALASYDTGWWVANPEALNFQGRKFSHNGYNGTEPFDVRKLLIPGGTNSGLFAMFIAREVFKAEQIILLGFDMHRRNGQHFFGPHTKKFNNQPLINTTEDRFKIHIKQFQRFSGCDVINATPGSDLKYFPFKKLNDIIK